MPTFQDYKNVVRSSSAQRIVQLNSLDANNNIIGTITNDIISGNLQLSNGNGDPTNPNGTGSRKNLNIVFDNSSGNYTPVFGSNFWLGKRYQLFTGYMVQGVSKLFSRGIFLIAEPDLISNFSEITASHSFYDLWAKVDGTLGGILNASFIIPAGTPIQDAVISIFQEIGEINPPIIEPIDTITPYTLTLQPGDNYGSMLDSLSKMISYVCFYDSDGYPRFEKPTISNYATTPSVWNFSPSECTYLGSQQQYDYSKLANDVWVYAENVNSSTIYVGHAQNTDINSPISIPNTYTKTKVISDNLIYSTELSNARANYELLQAQALVMTDNMKSLPIDLIDVDQIISITDPALNLDNDRFIVQKISFPLTNADSDMTLTVTQTRNLG